MTAMAMTANFKPLSIIAGSFDSCKTSKDLDLFEAHGNPKYDICTHIQHDCFRVQEAFRLK